MKFQPENFYHVFNRGNNKQVIFPRKENYYFFLKKIKKELSPCCSIIAYCLMPNHYHLLIYTGKEDHRILPSGRMQVLERKLGTVQSSYTRAINNQEKKTGSLFQAKLKVIELSEEHAFICFHYIHQNPVKAGLCSKFEDWVFSSYSEYINGSSNEICNRDIVYNLLKIPAEAMAFIEHSKDAVSNDAVAQRMGK
jgi:putative transposase